MNPGIITRHDLTSALIEANMTKAREALFASRQAGESVAALCDGPIAEALRRVGERWKHGPEGIVIEHQTTVACIEALALLRYGLFPKGDRTVAIGGTPAGDLYQVATMMAGLVAIAEGINAVNLGPNVPLDVLVKAIRMYKPAFVWLSFTEMEPGRAYIASWRPLLAEVEERKIPLIVGGQSFPGSATAESTCVHYLPTMVSFADWVRARQHAA